MVLDQTSVGGLHQRACEINIYLLIPEWDLLSPLGINLHESFISTKIPLSFFKSI